MSATLALSTRLAALRLRDARGAGTLDLFAVLAFGVTAWLSFVVSSGTWMFWHRQQEVPAWLAATMPPGDAAVMTTFYVFLAGIACALLVVPILALGGAAARLGARGGARRLAALRLVGMTSGEVVVMSVVESLVQAAAGLVVGLLAWLATVPLLGLLVFQNTPVGAAELLMPWWLWLAVAGVILALAAASTVLGLARVRISPLGVSRQATTPALRAWRAGALVLGVLAIGALGVVMRLDASAVVIGVTLVGLLAFGVTMANLFSPWLLQVVARFGLRTGSPARLLAMRRIVADPRSAWRNVSSLALIGFVVGMVASTPLDSSVFAGMDPQSRMIMEDVRTGSLLTLGIALVVGAVSTALTQASDVVDRTDELVTLDKMGVPPELDAAVRRHQVALPLLFTLAVSLGLGLLAAVPFVATLPEGFTSTTPTVALLGATVVVALALSLLAAEATRPLRRRALTTQVRRND